MIASHTAPHVYRMPFLLYRIECCTPPLYPRHAVHRIAHAVRRRCTAFCGALLLGDAAADLASARPNPADGIPDLRDEDLIISKEEEDLK
jgi:hypothetical protein